MKPQSENKKKQSEHKQKHYVPTYNLRSSTRNKQNPTQLSKGQPEEANISKIVVSSEIVISSEKQSSKHSKSQLQLWRQFSQIQDHPFQNSIPHWTELQEQGLEDLDEQRRLQQDLYRARKEQKVVKILPPFINSENLRFSKIVCQDSFSQESSTDKKGQSSKEEAYIPQSQRKSALKKSKKSENVKNNLGTQEKDTFSQKYNPLSFQTVQQKIQKHYQSYPTLKHDFNIQTDGPIEYSLMDSYIYKDYDQKTHTYCPDTLLNQLYEQQLKESTTLFFPQLSTTLRKKWSEQWDLHMGNQKVSRDKIDNEYIFKTDEISQLASLMGLNSDSYEIVDRKIVFKESHILKNLDENFQTMASAEERELDFVRLDTSIKSRRNSVSSNDSRKIKSESKRSQLKQFKTPSSLNLQVQESEKAQVSVKVQGAGIQMSAKMMASQSSAQLKLNMATPNNKQKNENDRSEQEEIGSEIDWFETVSKTAIKVDPLILGSNQTNRNNQSDSSMIKQPFTEHNKTKDDQGLKEQLNFQSQREQIVKSIEKMEIKK